MYVSPTENSATNAECSLAAICYVARDMRLRWRNEQLLPSLLVAHHVGVAFLALLLASLRIGDDPGSLAAPALEACREVGLE